MSLPQVPESWALYGALILFIATIISGATPKLLQAFGKWGEAVQERLDRQRSAAKASDDADIAEQRRQIAYLRGRTDEMAAEMRRRDELIREHAPWDWARFEEGIRRGEHVDHPPPLIPYVAPPPPPASPEGEDRVD